MMWTERGNNIALIVAKYTLYIYLYCTLFRSQSSPLHTLKSVDKDDSPIQLGIPV